MSFLRLRQVCLVAADLEREAASLGALFGLEVCHRDPNVAKYGLVNVLFPVGTTFLEIVSPTRPGTAAGRFLERHGGKHGYMVILDCDDPERWGRRAESLGVRVANVIRHDAYFGVQLHPKDTGAAMLEFNSTVGGADLMGAYAPAGPRWQRFVRTGRVRSIAGVEIEAPDPERIAARWASILERSVHEMGNGKRRILLDAGTIDFLPSSGDEEILAGVILECADRAAIAVAAKAAGCLGADGTLEASGARFRLG
ncbi:MAG TPA: VOC family protein [Burkholderiales bacterium]|nr:VOC family protein [Burkholderiales bacterium]